MHFFARLNTTDCMKPMKKMILLALFLLIVRLMAMYWIPLNDSTEARYGEIARIMQETGDWITPMHHYGEAFWAKPPLSTWFSAISMKGFGAYAWAARLPAIGLSFAILLMIWRLTKRYRSREVADVTVIVLASSLYFFLDAGTVMTDPTLLFCTTLSLISFWRAVVMQERLASYLFFVGLGLGLLAKGPIAVVLVGMPLFVWLCWQKQWRACWQRLPWISGSLLMLAIACPWYYLAERKTPGFIHYFIVGEHIQRFLQPGWAGDKYGFAHTAPLGMIWAYAFLGFMPWTLLVIAWVVRHFKNIPKITRAEDAQGWLRYLALCALVPLCFFTFARNIIYPYVFPCLPFMALLFAELAVRSCAMPYLQQYGVRWASVTGFIFLIATGLFIDKPEWVSKSQDRVVAAYQHSTPSNVSHDLIYWDSQLDYSAQFYAQGQVKATLDAQQLDAWLQQPGVHYVVTSTIDLLPFPPKWQKQQMLVTKIPYHYGTYNLLKMKSA